MSKQKKLLSRALYKRFLETMPITTVDYIVVRKKGENKEFLMGKRNNKPCKNRWLLPGGRLLKQEKLEDALRRKLKEEFGITSFRARFIFPHTQSWSCSELGVGYSSLMNIFLVRIGSGIKLKLNSENKNIGWFKYIESNFPKSMKEILEKAGFRYAP